MKFAPLIDPAVRKPAPKPVRVDLRKVFAIGTGLWIVALIVVLILLAVGYSVMPLVIMCVAGVIIGLLLLVWEYFDRWDYRRLDSNKVHCANGNVRLNVLPCPGALHTVTSP